MAGDQDKNDETAGDKAQEIFGNDGIVWGQMRRCKGWSQRTCQHVKVNRDNEPTAKNTAGESRTKNDKSDNAGNSEQNPVCPGNENQYAFLNFH